MSDKIPNLTVLAFQVKSLRDDLEEMTRKFEKMEERVNALYDLLNQGRGMKTLAVIVFSLFGVGGLLALLQAIQPFMKGH